MDIKNIVARTRENAIKSYDSNKKLTNTDQGHEMIVFLTKTLEAKKVNDWGRDEDKDYYLGIDKSGWIEYSHRIEYFAGPIKIKDSKVSRVSDEYVISYLQSKDCTDKEYLMFMAKAYNFS